jgi:DeoR/GlpR family transcriptional regulator of sugar metabolism
MIVNPRLRKNWDTSGMKAEERRQRIVHVVTERGFASIAELSQQLEVSAMTVRRDLDRLDREGLVVRQHGGASLERVAGNPELPYFTRETALSAEKEAIGRCAASQVRPHEAIFLDAGTTTYCVAKRLSDEPFTVATYSLPIVNLLSHKPKMTLYCAGGEFCPELQCFLGPEATAFFDQIAANTLFLATTGLSTEKGLTTKTKAAATVKRAMIESAERVILLMDSSKMHKRTFCLFSQLHSIDRLITDAGLRDEDRKLLEDRGISVVVCGDEES